MANEEKKVLSMRDAIKKINKACKEWDILGSGDFSKNLKKLSLGTLGFDLPFKGGIPYGQLVTFSGVEHSGKTSAAALAMAAYQKENPEKICVWVDAENTLLTQASYLHNTYGISYDPSCFTRYDCTGRCAEEIFQDLIFLQGAEDIGMIVIDSARALISQADLDSDFTKDNGQRASIAKPMGKFIKNMIMYLPRRNNILLIINQVNVEKTAFATSYTEPCGYALKYFPSVKVRFGTRTYTLGEKTDYSLSTLRDKRADGLRLHFAIVKSRLGSINKEGGFITVRYSKGVDTVFDLVEVGLKSRFIQRPTTKSYELVDLITGEAYHDKNTGVPLHFNSEDELTAYLSENPAFVKEFSEMIAKYLAESKETINLIDEAVINELMKQERDTMPDGDMTEASALIADGVDDE